MGFQTKIQLIKRKNSEQWYVNFPSAVAQALEFEKGEVFEWIIEGKDRLTLRRLGHGEEKKNEPSLKLTESMREIFEQSAQSAFKQRRCFERAWTMMLAAMMGFGRKTMAAIMVAMAEHDQDWSANYRLFSKSRINVAKVFDVVRENVIRDNPCRDEIVAAIDETRIPKRGKKVSGASWHRDPLGPKFQTNFLWGQRFLQVSLLLPDAASGPCMARGIPIAFVHCPLPPKPKRNPTEEELKQFRQKQKQERISVKGNEQIHILRNKLNRDPSTRHRLLVMTGDGGFTNAAVLKDLPDNTCYIGRTRKDAKFFLPPDPTVKTNGRKRLYGDRLPTPQEILEDESYPWVQVQAFAAGKTRTFKVKTLNRIKSQSAGGQAELRLVVIAPLGYRLKKEGSVNYRKPAYLICTDPTLKLEKLLQYYVWRWEIEVNFKDEKTWVGAGDSHVHKKESVANLPAFMVAGYSIMMLAAHRAYGNEYPLPIPKWQINSKQKRISTPQAISILRHELWGPTLRQASQNVISSGSGVETKCLKVQNALYPAVIMR